MTDILTLIERRIESTETDYWRDGSSFGIVFSGLMDLIRKPRPVVYLENSLFHDALDELDGEGTGYTMKSLEGDSLCARLKDMTLVCGHHPESGLPLAVELPNGHWASYHVTIRKPHVYDTPVVGMAAVTVPSEDTTGQPALRENAPAHS
jgi:hypothetical protein